MRLSLAGSIGWLGSTYSSRLPLPLVSSTNGDQPCAFWRIAGLVEHLGVDPAGHRAGAAEPQRIVGVIAELRVMRAEAGVDEGVLHRLGIEHRHLARRLLEREHLGGGMVRALLAEGRIVHAAHGRGEPDPALLVEHRVVVVGAGVPELLVAPIGRRLQRLDAGGMAGPERFRHFGILHRHLEERHLVGLRIEDRHVVGRIFRRAVERAVGIDRRIAPVRRDQVVQIFVRRRPFPRRDDDVALDALRPRRLVLGQFALGDAVGPVAEILERHAAEIAGELVGHLLAGLAGLDAAHPGFFARLELAEGAPGSCGSLPGRADGSRCSRCCSSA